jgi:two-component system sensor histidine kinase DegS
LAGIATDFKTFGNEKRLSPQIESTLFRVIQEATGNIVRHAHAKNVSASIHVKKNAVKVQIRDNGKGFDVQEAINYMNRPRGLGLLGMRERVELMNGTLNISSRLNAGTKIDIEIPL